MVALGLGEVLAVKNTVIIAGLLFGILFWIVIKYKEEHECVCVSRAVYALIIMVIGYALMTRATAGYSKADNISADNEVIVTGTVVDNEAGDNGETVRLHNTYCNIEKMKIYLGKVIIFSDKMTDMLPGNKVRIRCQIRTFLGARNEGNFDDKLYYNSIGISAVFYQKEVLSVEKSIWPVRSRLLKLKIFLSTIIYRICNEENASVLDAMLLGQKNGISTEVKELYQSAGIYHLCCISGTHMVVIGLGVYSLFRKKFKFLPAGVCGIIAILMYSLMVGLSVSVLRAVIMLVCRLAADMTGRTYDMISALGFSAVIAMIMNPYVIYNSGFLLSYGAVAAICTALPVLKQVYIREERTLAGRMQSVFITSMTIQIFTLPVLAWNFCELPVYAVLVNLIVIPCIVYILISGIAGITVGIINIVAGSFLAGVSNYGLVIYKTLCSIINNLPFNMYVTGRPSINNIVIYYVILLIIIVILWKNYKRDETFKELFWYVRVVRAFLTVGIIGILMLLITVRPNRLPKISIMDVGQGDSILLRPGDGMNYLIDGGSSDIKNVAKYRILPCLKAKGIDKIDYAIVTHSDADHINGISELLSERSGTHSYIRTLVLPDINNKSTEFAELIKTARLCGIKIIYICAGQRWKSNKYSIDCMYPIKNMDSTDVNEMCTVISFAYNGFRMTFMGDIGTEGETELLKMNSIMKSDILKVGHHGSKNSSSDEFLAKVHPRVSVISSGINNRFGHPHNETLDRLRNIGSQAYVTAKTGEVTITIKDNSYTINTMKSERIRGYEDNKK